MRFESVERRIVEGMYGAAAPEKDVSDPVKDLLKVAEDHLATRRVRKAPKRPHLQAIRVPPARIELAHAV